MLGISQNIPLHPAAMLPAVLLASIFIFKVAALPGSGAGLFKPILARQAPIDPSQIPAQCRDQGCDTFISAISTCQNIPDASCLCSNANEQAWAQCLECLQPTNPTPQDTINQFISECQQDGISLPPTSLLTGAPIATQTGLGSGSTPTGVIPEPSATGIITSVGSRSAQASGIMQTLGPVGSTPVGEPSVAGASLTPENTFSTSTTTGISQITVGSAPNTAGATVSIPLSNNSNSVVPLVSMLHIASIFTVSLLHAVLA